MKNIFIFAISLFAIIMLPACSGLPSMETDNASTQTVTGNIDYKNDYVEF